MKNQWRFLLLALIFSAGVFAAAAQEKKNENEDDAPIKINTTLLTVPVTVSDRTTGRNVAGLKREDFAIYQDGARQDIEFFFDENAPMNVAILLDTSFSTREVLDKIQKAAKDFIKVLRPEDRGLIVTFDAQTTFLSDLTSDRKVLSKAVERARIADQPGSDANDAVAQIVNKYFKQFEGRKAIIVLTDGMAMGQRLSAQQTLDLLQETDTIFYPIIFKTNFYSPVRRGGGGARQSRPPLPIELMKIFAGDTGGRFYEKDAANLKEAFQSIAEELKKQYLIGFYPQNYSADTGKPLGHIRVAVNREDLRVNLKKRKF